HTRWPRDWSSDVCSSDLGARAAARAGVVQVALSMVLVVGALLFGRTLKNLGAVELGFDPDVVVVAVDLSRTAVRPEARTQTLARSEEGRVGKDCSEVMVW